MFTSILYINCLHPLFCMNLPKHFYIQFSCSIIVMLYTKTYSVPLFWICRTSWSLCVGSWTSNLTNAVKFKVNYTSWTWLQATQPTSSGAVTMALANFFVNCVDTFRPHQCSQLYRFWASWPCGPARWQALLLIKTGDVGQIQVRQPHTNKSGFVIFHRQLHGRKPISIRCNRIEHWVLLWFAGIRLVQYTDTWTCHIHKESGLTQT